MTRNAPNATHHPPKIQLENPRPTPYHPLMNTIPPHPKAPPRWLESLAKSEAERAAGQTVSGEAIMRELYESIARMEAKHTAKPKRKAQTNH